MYMGPLRCGEMGPPSGCFFCWMTFEIDFHGTQGVPPRSVPISYYWSHLVVFLDFLSLGWSCRCSSDLVAERFI